MTISADFSDARIRSQMPIGMDSASTALVHSDFAGNRRASESRDSQFRIALFHSKTRTLKLGHEMNPTNISNVPLYDEMGRRWLGLGNIDGPIWFCGLEPGGTDSLDWPTIWAERYHAAEVIDGRGQAGDPDHDRHFGANGKPQRTWQPLIRTLLAYQGHAVDDLACLTFQREHFLAGDGDVALLELSAYAAAGMRVDVPREKYLGDRIVRIRELLEEKKPEIFVCYGTTRRKAFESIVGRPFDSEGFQLLGTTVCALRTHPTPQFRAAPPASSWVELGLELRRRVDALRIR